MTEVPTTDWTADFDEDGALAEAPRLPGTRLKWRRIAGVVGHVFTHFPLELVIYTAKLPTRSSAPPGMRWVPVATLADEALPNLMRKVIAHGLGQ